MKIRHRLAAIGSLASAAVFAGTPAAGRSSRRRQRRRKPARRAGAEDPEQPLLHRHAARRQEAAQKAGVDLVVQAAEREIDVEKQMQIIENLIQTGDRRCSRSRRAAHGDRARDRQGQRGGDPGGGGGHPRGSAAAAKDAGIKIDTFVGSDNYEGGRLAGEYLVEAIRAARRSVARARGDSRPRDRRLAPARVQGGDRGRIRASTIVASQPANWERDLGFNVFQNMLQAHPEIDAVFACNDMMALGAMEAIAAGDKTGKIKVVGFDAVDDARKAIAAGTMAASVAQFPAEMGRVAVESAVQAPAGRSGRRPTSGCASSW